MKKTGVILIIAFITVGIFFSGCLSEDENNAESNSVKTGASDYYPHSTGTKGEDSYPQDTQTYPQDTQTGNKVTDGDIVFDEAIEFDTVYTVTSNQGDIVDISATSSAPASYVCLDEEGYNLLMNDGDSSDIGSHIIDEFSVYDTETYHQSITFNQDGALYLAVLQPDGSVSISGHIKAVRYSASGSGSSTPSTYDPQNEEVQENGGNENNRGTQGVKNTYTAWDMDFDENDASSLIYQVDLIPGDTIEVTAETNIPANFISGDDQFAMCYIVGDGNLDSYLVSDMDHGSVYQEESYSNARYYELTKEMNRNFFSLAIQNPAGDSSLTGHIKVVVHSKYTEAEHDTTMSSY